MHERSSRFTWQAGDLVLVSSPYWIDSQDRSIRAWAPFRPPFQPEPGSIPWNFRAELRRSVARLHRDSDAEILRCRYVGSVRGLVDTENVLLYNIGPGYFARVGARGVRFLRSYAQPPAAPVALDPAAPLHYLEYDFTDPSSNERGTAGRVLASWRDVPWPSIASVPKVAAFWLALRTSTPTVYGHLDDPVAPFGIRIEIGTDNDALRPVHVLKPLLDAVVSAFHLQLGADRDLVGLVADQARTTDLGRVANLLSDAHYNVLGERAVVGLYRGGVKWNPSDERCVFAEVVLRRRKGHPAFSGQLFAVD